MWKGVTPRQRDCLEWIEVLNNQGVGAIPYRRASSVRNQYTYGIRGTKVKVLDMRVIRPLLRKGLIILLYPQLNAELDSVFYPILTELGKKVVDRDL